MASNPTIVLSAQDNASRVLQSVRGELSRLDVAAGKLKGVLGTIGVGISANLLSTFVRSTVDGIDALNDLKDATGASIENLSALEDVAARTGTSFDAVGTSLTKFNAALSEAKPGSAAERAFQALGLSVQQLKTLDPAEALRQTAVALSRFADDGNKARLVQELFGKSLREVAPFLNDLATQTALVAKVTAEQAEAAERFNQSLAALAKNATDARRALLEDLVVGINAAAKAYRESGLAEAVRVLFMGDASFQANKDFTEAVAKRLEIEKEIQELRARGFSEDSRGVQAQRVQLAAVNAEIKRLQALRAVADGSNESAAETARLRRRNTLADISVAPAKVKEKADSIAPVTTELDRYYESLTKTLEKEQELSEVQLAQRRIAEASAQGFSEAQRAAILDLAARVDKERELKKEREDLLRQAQELDAAMTAGDEAVKKRLDSLLAATPSRQLEEARRDQELLAQAFKAGALSEQEYLEAAAARAGITSEKLKETKSLAEELGLTFSSAFEDAIVGGKKFSEVLKGLQQDILRMVVRQTITEPLGGFLSGKIKDIFGGFFAAGGDPPLGRVSVVGENGPELFVPKTAGTIVPNGAMGGASVTVVNHFAVGDIASVSMVRDAMAGVTRTMQAQIARSLTHGGALA